MRSEQQQQLLAYLNEHGFEGAALEGGLTEGISSQVPSFSIRHQLDFGEEKMRFVLRFERDLQFDAYRLTGYEAAHVSAVKIEHKEVNGVDTAALEQRMATIDWPEYFRWREKFGYPKDRSDIAEIMLHLNQLAADSNSSGKEIQQLLMYKFWPEQSLDGPGIGALRAAYEHTRVFEVSTSGLCHANLAYQILSGHLDNLYELLTPLAVHELKPDLYQELAGKLALLPDNFEIVRHYYNREGSAEIRISVERDSDSGYRPAPYQVSFTRYPAVVHGVFNGVDTREVEASIAAVDWKDDSTFTIADEEGEPEFTPRVTQLLDNLSQLNGDPAGRQIADLLLLKFSSSDNFLDMIMDQSTFDYEASLPKVTQQFSCEVPVEVGINLLQGRPVSEQFLIPTVPHSEYWLRLDMKKESADGDYPPLAAGLFTRSELDKILLGSLPLESYRVNDIRNALLRGAKAEAILRSGKTVLVEAVPEEKSIRLYNPEGQVIPVNYSFNPDWNPPGKEQQKAGQKPESPPLQPHKKHRFRRGRGPG